MKKNKKNEKKILQSFKPTLWSKSAGLSNFEKLEFDGEKISIKMKSNISCSPIKIYLNQIQFYTMKEYLFYNLLTIQLKDNTVHKIKGFPSSEIKIFHEKIDPPFAAIYYEYHYDKAIKLEKQLLNNDIYWTKLFYRTISNKLYKELSKYKELNILPLIEQKEKIDFIYGISKRDEKIRVKHNNSFIQKEKITYKNYFDNIESNPLTEKQKEAVIVNEKNNLIIAGAGSGKTSVMVAKTGYLISKYKIEPKNILLLSFNKKASIELKDRIKEKLKIEVDSMTFHALGMLVIADVENKKPSLGPWAEDDKALKSLIENIISLLFKTNKNFNLKMITYFEKMMYTYVDQFDCKTEGEYIEYMKNVEMRSFNGELMKSYEECEIANFLFINKISYQYEPKYEYDVSTKEYSQYQPDFYLPDYKIYIEHFGIKENGETAPWIDEKKYHEGMAWKRALHRHYETKLIETYSYEKSRGELTSKLTEKLLKENIKFDLISTEKALDVFNKNGMSNVFVKLCKSFLTNYKSNNFSFKDIESRTNIVKNLERADAFVDLFKIIYEKYEDHQKQQKMIDFNDMINKAVKYIESGEYKSKYTHILVDEFQDISTVRSKMVEKLLAQKKDSQLCVVGDDWQAINRFAGSDISIVRNFESIYGDSTRVDLDYTFRYNNKILEISQNFIEKNPNQLKKSIKTVKVTEEDAIFIWWDSFNIIESIKSMLNTISYKRPNEKLSLLVLARFWSIIPDGLKSLNNLYPNININGLTIHASKGLEADYVIILGNKFGKLGFPSAIEDDPILNIVLAESEEFKYAEERRLFYVAMTRAKDEVHLFASHIDRSPFIEELIDGNERIMSIGKKMEDQALCPKCGTGKLVKRKMKKNDYVFLACSNYPYCEYKEKIFYCPKCMIGHMIKDKIEKKYVCSIKSCNHTAKMCKCGGQMIKRKSRYGEFLGCNQYPKCKMKEKI